MSDVLEAARPRLDWQAKQSVSYAVPLTVRDLQIAANIRMTPHRLEPGPERGDEAVAVVGYGPSLNDTWEQIRDFTHVISTSGAHTFLIERGIIPWAHVDVDPRIHKLKLVGEFHPDVEYLIASTCHPEYFRRLVAGGFKHRLWHVFDNDEEAKRVLPAGEWALTGGCSVGLRAIALARFLGFTQIDVFGIDGCDGKTGKHAADHPNQAKKSFEVEYEGQIYYTTPGFLEAARTTAHEMDALKDVTARFHGDGLVQAMMRNYQRKVQKNVSTLIAFNKPELISDEYRQQNAQLHESNLLYGVSAKKHAETVKSLVKTCKPDEDGLPVSVLDYGCGKRLLSKSLPFPIWEYDPAIAEVSESPRPAHLVACIDVLEHIEPEKLLFVLDDLKRCVKQCGYFIINTGAAGKTLPDGRNTHLIQEGKEWWAKRLSAFFAVAKIIQKGKELHVIVAPLQKKQKVKPQPVLMSVIQPSYALDFSGLAFRQEPYTIGSMAGAMSHEAYRALSESFPDISLFKSFGEANRKWSLSSVNNPDKYAAFLATSEPWRQFHHYVKHQLIEQVAGVLKTHGIGLPSTKQLKARWEFSALPADGGCLRPHTDLASKLVTIVLSMRTLDDKAWQPSWGGGTEVLRLRDGDQPVPDDYAAEWEAFDVAHVYEYVPNQAVVFLKSNSSWHGVRPIAGEAGQLRRSVTINVERGL